MPSPLGHALGGFAGGWLVTGPPDNHGRERRGARLQPCPEAQAGAVGQRCSGTGDAPRHSWLRRVPGRALVFAALGMAADVDLLMGRHSQFTHSIGMTMAVALGAYAALRLRPRGAQGAHSALAGGTPRAPRARMLLAVGAAAAYASHIVLDWLAQDATPPSGITALWPFNSAYYLSHLDVFWGISREPWRPGVVWHDVLAIGRELLLLGPLALAAWWLRRPGRRQNLPAAARADAQQLPPGRHLPADGESR